MTGAFFLGICITYPNGLFNFSCFQVWPWAEDFLVSFRISAECMHSNCPCTCWYVFKCCCYCTFFDIQYFVRAIVVWTKFAIIFFGGCSKNYIVSCCISCCVVCYFNSRSTYFYVCDYWRIWCYSFYRELISIRPFTKYFLTIFITCPCMAVCIVSTLIYIFEWCSCLSLVFVNCIILFGPMSRKSKN